MANYMAKVANMLGVELDEEFKCSNGYMYMLTNSGIAALDAPWSPKEYCDAVLIKLIEGDLTIKRKPWKPEFNENYWTVMRCGDLYLTTWYDNIVDFHCYKLGNCYRTKEEAEVNRDKWISFYASDEVLEV